MQNKTEISIYQCDPQTQYECGGLGTDSQGYCEFCWIYCPCKIITKKGDS